MAVIGRDGWSDTERKAVREQLNRIFNSEPFRQSQRRQRFLKYIVNETLAGRSERLTGYNLALEIFDRPASFDPAVDPFVRIEAARLRDKLHAYYDAEGRNDPVRITLPKGTYTPEIEIRRAGAFRGHANQESLSAVPSIAVLSFDDLSAKKNLGYLGDGVAEDIITALSRFPDLAVVARGSSFAYKGKVMDVRQIGRKLGVDYVLEGSVRKDHDKPRIVAQFIDAKTGEHVWAERFDGSGRDPWALQDEITGMIVTALTGERGVLKQAEYRNAWGKDATTLEEYDFYLRGHEQLMKYAKEGIERSGEIWREGLTRFPGSPLLSVKLGWYHMIRAYTFVGDDPPADFKKAGELVRQVLSNERLSPQVARLARWLLSYVLIQERDFDGALAEAERTVALAPHDMFVLSRLMMVLVQAGRPDQALRWADQVSRCDPGLGWSYNYGKGWAYVATERFAEAAHVLKQTEFNDAHLLLAIAYSHLGRLADARAEVTNMMRINPAITLQKWRVGYSFREPAILERCFLQLGRAGLRE